MKTILVIEDDKEISGNIKFVLEKDYCRVFTTFTGRDGLDILKKEKISLVILDYILPDIDGLEILKSIKENYKIPVIMITAYGCEKAEIRSLLKYPPDCYFDKPFELKAIGEKVQELLRLPEKTFPFDMFGINPAKLSTHIRRALEFIGSNLSSQNSSNEKLTLRTISEVTSITPNHLCTLFRKECGKSIHTIITILRIEKAKRLLHDKKSVKEIAYELGYSHPNNFSRVFKKITGKSPSELRKAITKKF